MTDDPGTTGQLSAGYGLSFKRDYGSGHCRHCDRDFVKTHRNQKVCGSETCQQKKDVANSLKNAEKARRRKKLRAMGRP